MEGEYNSHLLPGAWNKKLIQCSAKIQFDAIFCKWLIQNKRPVVYESKQVTIVYKALRVSYKISQVFRQLLFHLIQAQVGKNFDNSRGGLCQFWHKIFFFGDFKTLIVLKRKRCFLQQLDKINNLVLYSKIQSFFEYLNVLWKK